MFAPGHPVYKSKMAMDYWAGDFLAFDKWDKPTEYSMAILDLYIYLRLVKMIVKNLAEVI